MGFDIGSLIGGAASELIMAERSRDVSARAAADSRQAEEREAEKSRAFSSQEARISRDFASREAGITRDWTRDMSSTAHQREIRDLALAGLNPILSGTGGMGSASPAGAMAGSSMATSAKASVQTAGTPDYGRVVSSALDAKRNKADVDNLVMDTRKKHSEGSLASQLYNESQARTTNIQTEGRILLENLKGRKLEGDIDETRFGEVMRYLDRLKNSISPLKLGPSR